MVNVAQLATQLVQTSFDFAVLHSEDADSQGDFNNNSEKYLWDSLDTEN